jgi:hypothetical protein
MLDDTDYGDGVDVEIGVNHFFGHVFEQCQTSETGGDNQSVDVAEAVKEMVRVRDTFYPNKENAKIYDYLYKEVYLKMYPGLAKTYAKIKRFNNGEIKK